MTEQEYRKAHPAELRVYDMALDAFRAATQSDIELLVEAGAAYGRLRQEVQRIHAGLMKRVREINGDE